MTLFLWILFGIAVAIPALAAIGTSIHDISTQRITLLKHAPRHEAAATVLIFHRDLSATRRSIRQLRRMRSLHLSIVVVVPAGSTLNATLSGVQIYQPERPMSRRAALVGAHALVDPRLPLLIINSGDIIPAVTIHTALRQFHTHPQLTYVTSRKTQEIFMSFYCILVWFGATLRHTLAALRIEDLRKLPSGTWLRTGELLSRLTSLRSGIYLSSLTFAATDTPQLPLLSTRTLLAELIACTVAGICYGMTLATGLTVPIIGYWIVAAWWLVTLLTLYPAKRYEKVIGATIVPIAGVVLPVWHLIILGNALLQRLRQHLPWARRQYVKHGIFFRLRHP